MKNNLEDYLLVIWETDESFGEVSEKEVATRLNVSLPTAWEVLHKLGDEGLVNVDRNGIIFTERGKEYSGTLMRAHRIIEYFAYSFLEIPWEESHEAVMYLEHGFSGKTLETLHKNMGYPSDCPHGNPINIKDKRNELNLSEVSGGSYEVKRVVYEEKNFLKGLADAGSKPGMRIKTGRDNEKIWIQGENGEFTFDKSKADGIRVHPK
ncbi:MAG: metal-dependent transcriptional regulator [Candidatus Thermoplasmatota archaeon]|jgi:DtxR family Mn-dependent transcriptional regulator|nr:metal-dependent transcriptional regulator [Candidatus Thermoplasmatota archaeon]